MTADTQRVFFRILVTLREHDPLREMLVKPCANHPAYTLNHQPSTLHHTRTGAYLEVSLGGVDVLTYVALQDLQEQVAVGIEAVLPQPVDQVVAGLHTHSAGSADAVWMATSAAGLSPQAKATLPYTCSLT